MKQSIVKLEEILGHIRERLAVLEILSPNNWFQRANIAELSSRGVRSFQNATIALTGLEASGVTSTDLADVEGGESIQENKERFQSCMREIIALRPTHDRFVLV